MGRKVAAAALQYSKWLSRFICWIWAIQRFMVIIASTIRPEAAEALVSMMYTLDWIMLVNEGTYLINSLGEKYIYSDRLILHWLDKDGMKQMFKSLKSISAQVNDEEEDVEDGDDNNG